MEDFGSRLQFLRKQHGLTQDNLAERLMISPQAVSKWENGLTSPDMETLVRLADMFNISLDELLGRAEKKPVQFAAPGTKNLEDLMLRIRIQTGDLASPGSVKTGDFASPDSVNINIPFVLVRELGSSATNSLVLNGVSTGDIPFDKIVALVERGVIGNILELDTSDGPHISISVE